MSLSNVSAAAHHPLPCESTGRQILGIFIRRGVGAGGTLTRNYFVDVRDGDFQRGLDAALANNWITIDARNRYRYALTATGFAAGRMLNAQAAPVEASGA